MQNTLTSMTQGCMENPERLEQPGEEGGEDKLCAHVVKLTFHRYSDIQEECGSSRIATALLLNFARVRWGTTALLTCYPMLNT